MAYIPEKHKKYKLLPNCTKYGGEVFSYPGLENKISKLLPEGVLHVIPYGYESYSEFYSLLDDYISKYGTTDGALNELGMLIAEYKAQVQKMNVKENWSVLRYKGKSNSQLTHGRYYYWPCSVESPEYEGVIDDEEFTSYLAADFDNRPISNIKDARFTSYSEPPSRKPLWEIAEDPTGMAAKHLNIKQSL